MKDKIKENSIFCAHTAAGSWQAVSPCSEPAVKMVAPGWIIRKMPEQTPPNYLFIFSEQVIIILKISITVRFYILSHSSANLYKNMIKLNGGRGGVY